MTTVTRKKTFTLPDGLDDIDTVVGIDVGSRNMGWCVATRTPDGAASLRMGLFDGAPDPLTRNMQQEEITQVPAGFAREVLRGLDPAHTFIPIEKQIPRTVDGKSNGECMAIETGLHGVASMLGFRAMSIDPKHTKAYFAAWFPTAGDYLENKEAASALIRTLYSVSEAAMVDAIIACQRERVAAAKPALDAERVRLATAVVVARGLREDAQAALVGRPVMQSRERTAELRLALRAAQEAERVAAKKLKKLRDKPKPYKTEPFDMDEASVLTLAVASCLPGWGDVVARRQSAAFDVMRCAPLPSKEDGKRDGRARRAGGARRGAGGARGGRGVRGARALGGRSGDRGIRRGRDGPRDDGGESGGRRGGGEGGASALGAS